MNTIKQQKFTYETVLHGIAQRAIGLLTRLYYTVSKNTIQEIAFTTNLALKNIHDFFLKRIYTYVDILLNVYNI